MTWCGDVFIIAWNNFVMSGETILVFLRHAECCTFLLNYIEIGLDGHKAYCLVAFCELSKNIYFFLIKYLPKNTVTMNSSLFSNITFPKIFILFFFDQYKSDIFSAIKDKFLSIFQPVLQYSQLNRSMKNWGPTLWNC